MVRILFLSLLYLFIRVSNSEAAWVTQNYNPNVVNIEQNPLKGLIPAFNTPMNGFPHSMEFFYIPLRSIMLGINNFNWTSFDNELVRINSQGKHAIFRVYLDYPGRTTGIPQFLLDGGLTTNNYTDYGNANISKSPNWNDANLILALENFIAALGTRYDGNPGISYITAGIYGFWGEWHNFPYAAWDMSQANKDRIITAYKNAFINTHVQLRDPNSTTNAVLKNYFGYHDDSFAYETLGPDTWHFWIKMTSAGLTNNWQTHPMGGEIYPPVQTGGLWNNWPNTVGQDYQTCVTTTHASWMMNHSLFDNFSLTAAQTSNALKGTKLLGYEFFVSSVNLSDILTSGPITVDLNIQNKGVAPIYYNWTVQFAVINTSTLAFTSVGTTNWNVNAILSGGANYLKSFSGAHSLGVGTYKLLMRLVNPLEALYASSKKLRFANEKQDADLDGWLTLGSFNVSATLPVELLSFSGLNNGDKVNLTWTTTGEKNFDKFEIEKNYTGDNAFEYVGSVAGKGFTDDINNYFFTDVVSGNGKIYYRLKQIDNDGIIVYSDIIEVFIGITGIKIFPNPIKINHSNKLILTSPYTGEAEISWVDLSGKLIVKETTYLNIGENYLDMVYYNFTRGFYFLKIISRDGSLIEERKIYME